MLTSATLGSEHAPLAPDGCFELEPLLPGDYTAKVVCPNCGALATKPVKLVSGATFELLFP